MTMPTPNPHLALADAAEQRANAATPGPWIIKQMTHRDDWPRLMSAQDPGDLCHVSDLDDGIEVKDQDFITHARQDVPALAAAVREQAATIAALQTSLTASERRECAYRAHLEELGYTGAVEEGVYTRCKPISPMRSRWRRRGG